MGNSRDKKLYDKTKLTMTGWFNTHWKSMNTRQRKKFGKDLTFDRWEFEKWIIDYNFLKFTDLFFKFANSNYNKELCPSVDRINPYNDYSFNNMQLITWRENKEKGWNEKKEISINAMIKKTRKAVVKLSIEGLELNRYDSLSEASRLNNISTSIICECCQGKRKTGKGYRWMYE